MSWSDKEIDKLFKENADAKSFEYKDEYWNEMEALLPSSRGKDFLWMFTSIAFIGLLLTSEMVGENRMIAMNQSETALVAENSSQALTNKYSNEANGTEVVSEQNNDELTKNESSDSFTADNAVHQTPSESTPFTEEQLTTSNDLEENSVKGSLTVSTETSIVSENVTSVDSDVVSDIDDLEDKSVEIDQLIDIELNSIEDVLSFKPMTNVDGLFVNREIQASEAPIMSPIKPIQTKIYIAGLGGLSQSMVTPSDKVSSSFGIGAGVQLRKGGFLFNLGVNGIVGIHNDIILSRESKVYGFGSTFYKYELKYKTIYNIEGDFSVGYQFRKSIFSLGVRPSYVVGTEVGMRTQENEADFVQEKYYGYFDGINRLGVKPMIGYTYKFGSGLSIGINAGVQLMPLVKNDFVNGVSNKFPIDGQLILKKTLNFKK